MKNNFLNKPLSVWFSPGNECPWFISQPSFQGWELPGRTDISSRAVLMLKLWAMTKCKTPSPAPELRTGLQDSSNLYLLTTVHLWACWAHSKVQPGSIHSCLHVNPEAPVPSEKWGAEGWYVQSQPMGTSSDNPISKKLLETEETKLPFLTKKNSK